MAGIDGNFNFKSYDIDGNKILSRAEADKARADGWNIWNNFTEADSHLATQEGLGRIMMTQSSLYQNYLGKLTDAMEKLTGLQGRYSMQEWRVGVIYSDPEMQATLEKAKKIAIEAMRKEGIDISDDAFEFGENDKKAIMEMMNKINDTNAQLKDLGEMPSFGLTKNPAGQVKKSSESKQPSNISIDLSRIPRSIDYSKYNEELRELVTSRDIDNSRTTVESNEDGDVIRTLYDTNGVKIYEAIQDDYGTSVYYYDESGNQTVHVNRDENGVIYHISKSEYDENGSELGYSLYGPDGKISYTYANNQFVMYNDIGEVSSYRKDEKADDGSMKYTYYNSSGEPLFYQESEYGWDSDGWKVLSENYYLMNGQEITKEKATVLLGEMPY